MKAIWLAGMLGLTTLVQVTAGPLDINTATSAQLRALPGMGTVYAQRVIAGRPYTAKNQLATRGVLPQEEYQRIAALIVAHRAPKNAAAPTNVTPAARPKGRTGC